MARAVRLQTTVLPGGRIDITAPELDAGQLVEAIVLAEETLPPKVAMLDFLKSLTPRTRTAADWERIDQDFQDERAAWDR